MPPPADPPSDRTRPGAIQLPGGRAPKHPSLDPFESSPSAVRLQRVAESEILLRLQLTGFDPNSDDWRELMHALIEYGWAVFTGWGISGTLRRQVAAHNGAKGAHLIPEGLRLDPDDAAGLATELMLHVIDLFRSKVLAKGRWSQDGGASLKTYFVGWCLMHLARVYVAWNKHERVDGRVPSFDDPTKRTLQTSAKAKDRTPAQAADTRLELEAVVALIDDPEVVRMFELQAAGYELEAIAEVLGTTEGVVRTKMTRARKRTKGWRSSGYAS